MSADQTVDKYLRRLKNGEQCMDDFFNAYSGKIKLIARWYLVDKSFAGDVVTDTFSRVFESIQTYNGGDSGLAWICKIAQNEAYKINNRERKHTYVPLEDITEEVASVTDFTETSELMADVEEAINKLPETDKQIVVMRLIDCLTYTEIAQRLKMYVGTVFKRYNRAIKEISKNISL